MKLAKGDRVTCREVPLAPGPMIGTVRHVGWKVEVVLDREPVPGLGRKFALPRRTLNRIERDHSQQRSEVGGG